jgi:hypothetical protein
MEFEKGPNIGVSIERHLLYEKSNQEGRCRVIKGVYLCIRLASGQVAYEATHLFSPVNMSMMGNEIMAIINKIVSPIVGVNQVKNKDEEAALAEMFLRVLKSGANT